MNHVFLKKLATTTYVENVSVSCMKLQSGYVTFINMAPLAHSTCIQFDYSYSSTCIEDRLK